VVDSREVPVVFSDMSAEKLLMAHFNYLRLSQQMCVRWKSYAKSLRTDTRLNVRCGFNGRRRWMNNIKIDFGEMRCEGEYLIEMTQR
jgi:hypothetical protein